MAAKRFITTQSDDDGLVTHAVDCSGAGYDTLCGLDTNDKDTTGLSEAAKEDSGNLIDCPTCIATINASRRYRKSDFRNPSEWGKG